MRLKAYLTVGRNGSLKITKGKPGLSWDQISIAIDLEVPIQLFKRPQLSASIVIPEEASITREITAEVIDNIESAIETHSGLKVKLSISEDKTNETDE